VQGWIRRKPLPRALGLGLDRDRHREDSLVVVGANRLAVESPAQLDGAAVLAVGPLPGNPDDIVDILRGAFGFDRQRAVLHLDREVLGMGTRKIELDDKFIVLAENVHRHHAGGESSE
jgi:hypothetical protein